MVKYEQQQKGQHHKNDLNSRIRKSYLLEFKKTVDARWLSPSNMQPASPAKSFRGPPDGPPKPSPASERKPGEKPIVLGICSMDIKARSKAMREILTRLVEIEGPGLDIKIFGDKVILDDGSLPLSFFLSFSSPVHA